MMMYRLMIVWGLMALAPSWMLGDDILREPLVLARGQGMNAPKQPQTFVSKTGVIDVVYAVGETIHLSTSRDKGATFQTAAATIHCPNMPAGMRRGPRVVRTATGLVVTAIGGKVGKGKDGDVTAWHSTDEGATWSAGVIVNDVPAAAREGLHGMTVGPQGEVWCVWLDLRNGKMEIALSVSHDDGKTWSKNLRGYRSPSGSVCECCHPSIIAGSKTGVRVMFRNSLNGMRDMFLLQSNDDQTFTPGQKLGRGSWNLNACPMDGGMLASDGQNGLVTVWQRQNQIFATSENGMMERRLGDGQQPWVTWSAAGPVIVWTKGREGALSLQMGLTGTPRQIAPLAHDPVVASQPEHDFAVICYEAKQNGESRVLAQTIATPIGTEKKSKSVPKPVTQKR